MWQEVKTLHSVLPENAIGGVTIMNRKSYLGNSKVIHASGKHTPSHTLITSKPYTGPEIKPLLP